MNNGFYAPRSVASDIVKSQRGSQGDYKWDTAGSEIGLGRQAAMQSLNKQYSTTINQAYSDYLMANRGIRGSMMGEGYKEEYMRLSQEGLQANIAEANLNAQNLRSRLNQQESQARAGVQQLFDTEISNLNRVSQSAGSYLEYLKTVSSKTNIGQGYLTEEQKGLKIDDLYDVVFDAQPQNYETDKGDPALSYIDWVRANTKQTDADISWLDWLTGRGGLQQFRQGVSRGIKT